MGEIPLRKNQFFAKALLIMNKNKHISTIIVGAGPSGTTCGYLLAKSHKDCLIIDKMSFPREKTCGGGLTPKAHRLLEKIFKNIVYDYLPVRKMDFYTEKGLLTSYNLDTEIRNVVRYDFDKILLDEYSKAGGKFITARIQKIEEKDDKVFLHLNDGQTLSCDTLVGADGVNSFVRKYLQPAFPKEILMMEKKNNDKSAKDITIYFDKKYQCGYTYIFPNQKGTVIGYGHKSASIEEFDEEIARFGLSGEGKTKGAYIPAFGMFDYPFKKNIILVGDAGSYVDSVTFEGLYYAIKTGQNAAFSIISNEDFSTVNTDVIKRVKKLNRISKIFYSPTFQRLFVSACSQKKLHHRLNRIANYYINR